MSGAKLQIVAGTRAGTYSLGYILSGKIFRDPRFASFMHHKEAIWLLRNEWLLEERDRREGLALPGGAGA